MMTSWLASGRHTGNIHSYIQGDKLTTSIETARSQATDSDELM